MKVAPITIISQLVVLSNTHINYIYIYIYIPLAIIDVRNNQFYIFITM